MGKTGPKPQPRIIVPCGGCGKELGRTASQLERYKSPVCNAACAASLYEKRADAKVSVNCSNCATPIIKRKTELIRSKDLFCNRECKAQWVSKNKAGENHPLWEDKAVEFACRYCGVVFKAYQRHRRGERAYCSKDCATNDGRTVRECGWCCESFAVKKSRSEQCENVFCSKYCRGKYLSKALLGQRHPRFKHGHKYGKNWKQQQLEARKRDGFTCQRCGVHQRQLKRKLHVHHIVRFKSFGYVRGMNDNYIQANQLNNLITLCASCHPTVEAAT